MSEEFLLGSAPDEFTCPITQALMVDPVSTSDGHSYERQAIEQWLAQSAQPRSPLTSAPLQDLSLTQNHALKTAIRAWREQRASAVLQERGSGDGTDLRLESWVRMSVEGGPWRPEAATTRRAVLDVWSLRFFRLRREDLDAGAAAAGNPDHHDHNDHEDEQPRPALKPLVSIDLRAVVGVKPSADPSAPVPAFDIAHLNPGTAAVTTTCVHTLGDRPVVARWLVLLCSAVSAPVCSGLSEWRRQSVVSLVQTAREAPASPGHSPQPSLAQSPRADDLAPTTALGGCGDVGLTRHDGPRWRREWACWHDRAGGALDRLLCPYASARTFVGASVVLAHLLAASSLARVPSPPHAAVVWWTAGAALALGAWAWVPLPAWYAPLPWLPLGEFTALCRWCSCWTDPVAEFDLSNGALAVPVFVRRGSILRVAVDPRQSSLHGAVVLRALGPRDQQVLWEGTVAQGLARAVLGCVVAPGTVACPPPVPSPGDGVALGVLAHRTGVFVLDLAVVGAGALEQQQQQQPARGAAALLRLVLSVHHPTAAAGTWPPLLGVESGRPSKGVDVLTVWRAPTLLRALPLLLFPALFVWQVAGMQWHAAWGRPVAMLPLLCVLPASLVWFLVARVTRSSLPLHWSTLPGWTTRVRFPGLPHPVPSNPALSPCAMTLAALGLFMCLTGQYGSVAALAWTLAVVAVRTTQAALAFGTAAKVGPRGVLVELGLLVFGLVAIDWAPLQVLLLLSSAVALVGIVVALVVMLRALLRFIGFLDRVANAHRRLFG